MPEIRQIAVVLHERDVQGRRSPSLVWALCDVWEAVGVKVIVHRGIDQPIDADLVIPHQDLTIYPHDYIQFLDRHPLVINRDVPDISKRFVSRQLVRRGDDYDGPVVVKTDCNFGGMPERRLAGSPKFDRLDESSGVGGWWRRITGRTQRRRAEVLANAQWLDPEQYPIFDSLRDVPPAVWNNDALVVERFLPERDGRLYCLRSYVFFGEGFFNLRLTARQPIVKAHMAVDKAEVPVPDEIARLRQEMKIDYGKFDYVMHDGKAVLLDVSRTPSLGAGQPTPWRTSLVNRLAHGLATWDASLNERW